MLNLFDHQLFVVRTLDGVRATRTFREILTDPDEPLRLDYPHAFVNVGAVGLLTYLIQLLFDPEDEAELAHRLHNPLTVEEFERAVAPLRDRFTIDGDIRFMQGPPPTTEESPSTISTLLLSIRKDNEFNKLAFLNRPDPNWAVALDQVPLLLFTRNTFSEQAGGSGYQKGTAGEVGIRTILQERDPSGFPLLRRSLWRNVLHRAHRREHMPDAFADNGWDGCMWEKLPVVRSIPTGGTSLQAGLAWMPAFHYLRIEQVDGKTCMVTGRPLSERAATGVWKSPTGIAYGTKVGEKGSRLFRHPHVPTVVYSKTGGERQVTVHRTRGLAEAMGAVCYGIETPERSYHVAPVVDQLLRSDPADADLALQLFGFHMVGAMGGRHAGYEEAEFGYPLLQQPPPTPAAPKAQTNAPPGSQLTTHNSPIVPQIRVIIRDATNLANLVANTLQRALQETAGVSVEWTEGDNARLTIQAGVKRTAADFEFDRDTLAAYWRGVEARWPGFIGRIAELAPLLPVSRPKLMYYWGRDIVSLGGKLYLPHFKHYGSFPATIPSANLAGRRLEDARKKIMRGITVPEAFL